jgi:hypothetical protein
MLRACGGGEEGNRKLNSGRGLTFFLSFLRLAGTKTRRWECICSSLARVHYAAVQKVSSQKSEFVRRSLADWSFKRWFSNLFAASHGLPGSYPSPYPVLHNKWGNVRFWFDSSFQGDFLQKNLFQLMNSVDSAQPGANHGEPGADTVRCLSHVSQFIVHSRSPLSPMSQTEISVSKFDCIWTIRA